MSGRTRSADTVSKSFSISWLVLSADLLQLPKAQFFLIFHAPMIQLRLQADTFSKKARSVCFLLSFPCHLSVLFHTKADTFMYSPSKYLPFLQHFSPAHAIKQKKSRHFKMFWLKVSATFMFITLRISSGSSLRQTPERF